MNIFVTSNCPEKSAKNLDDRRCIKMCLETAQMLSTALRELGSVDSKLYKSTHKNHPCNVWVRETSMNYVWTLAHFEFLLEEYTARYGKQHKCAQLLGAFYDNIHLLPIGPLTDFANCAANDAKGVNFKHINDTTEAYRIYLNARWETDKIEPTWS